ncbi:hypothetical protein FHR84_004373 [Actinopolyspora biskrensis]|uniref:Uncharacterized protein n=1 Tax=Actinopolyspora biskrensis TaxID=1470178 RepID=A0A852Z4A9_9ACTN|nr:hypothetical protein [Actinopolyspora biskrensis]
MITNHVHTAMIFLSTENTNTTDTAGHTVGSRTAPPQDLPGHANAVRPRPMFQPRTERSAKKFLPVENRPRKSTPRKATDEKSSPEETFRVVRWTKTHTNERSAVAESCFPGRRCAPEHEPRFPPPRRAGIGRNFPRDDSAFPGGLPVSSAPSPEGGPQDFVPPIPHGRRNRRHGRSPLNARDPCGTAADEAGRPVPANPRPTSTALTANRAHDRGSRPRIPTGTGAPRGRTAQPSR